MSFAFTINMNDKNFEHEYNRMQNRMASYYERQEKEQQEKIKRAEKEQKIREKKEFVDLQNEKRKADEFAREREMKERQSKINWAVKNKRT